MLPRKPRMNKFFNAEWNVKSTRRVNIVNKVWDCVPAAGEYDFVLFVILSHSVLCWEASTRGTLESIIFNDYSVTICLTSATHPLIIKMCFSFFFSTHSLFFNLSLQIRLAVSQILIIDCLINNFLSSVASRIQLFNDDSRMNYYLTRGAGSLLYWDLLKIMCTYTCEDG